MAFPIDEKEKKEAGDKEEGFKRGGHKRKHGGAMFGEKSEHRPDRRARGGGVEHNPLSSAGHMSSMDYEGAGRAGETTHGGGKGGDKNTKGKG